MKAKIAILFLVIGSGFFGLPFLASLRMSGDVAAEIDILDGHSSAIGMGSSMVAGSKYRFNDGASQKFIGSGEP